MDITIFNNDLFGSIRTIVIDDKFYFIGRDIAEALGYANPSKAVSQHCKHVEKAMVDVSSQNGNAHSKARNTQEMSIIPESDVYRLIIKSKLPEAEKFEEWVMEEILPQLRATGVVILGHAIQEDIDFESLFGKARIYDTFFYSENVFNDYDKFKEWSKAKRDKNHHAFNNQDRIDLSKKIIEALDNKARFAIASKQPISVIVSYQELSSKIQADITALTNQRQGGIRAQVTRKLNKLRTDYDTLVFEYNELKTQYEEVQDPSMDDVLFKQGEDKDFLEIPYHGFSNNDMYKVSNNRMKRTPAYNYYENHFPKYLLRNASFSGDIDFTKPMACELLFDHTKGYDVHNFIKATLDIVSRTLEFNDRLIRRVSCATHEIVDDNFSDGKIYIKLYNIE